MKKPSNAFTIASALLASHPSLEDNALSEARRVDIVYCSRVRRQRLGQNRPISVMLNCRDDKEKIMSIKSKLPQGIYINNEYPMHIKHTRDMLQPILRLAKTLPEYREKSTMEGDHLVINGIAYGLHDIGKLSQALSGYKAAQKEDDHTIAFMEELSPYSNFHKSKFTINSHTYHSSKQWIQFQKAMLFGDSFTANQILTCDTPLEAKRLGYNVNGFDAHR